MIELKQSKLFMVIGCFFLSLLFIPIIDWSLSTPFAFIDDLTDWRYLMSFRTWDEVQTWASSAFIGSSNMRWRPGFELYTGVSWNLFGDSYLLHHLARLVLKGVGLLGGLLALRILTKSTLPLFLFFIGFMFVPIAPEARLVPQEALTVPALAWALYAYLALSLEGASTSILRPKVRTLGLVALYLVATLVLGMVKENNIIFLFGFSLAFLALVFWGQNKTLKKTYFFLFAYSLIWFLYIKVGRLPSSHLIFSLDHFKTNVIFAAKMVNLGPSSRLSSLILGVGLIYASLFTWKQRFSKPEVIIAIVFLGTVLAVSILVFGVFSMSVTIRYVYPSYFIYLLLACFGASQITSPRVSVFVFILAVICAFQNLHNLYFQYASQYYTRRDENLLLEAIAEYPSSSQPVYLLGTSEFEDKIFTYFDQFLPYFNKADGSASAQYLSYAEIPLGHSYVTMAEVCIGKDFLEKQFPNSPHFDSVFEFSKEVSAASRLYLSEPKVWYDAGSPMGKLSYPIWKLCRKDS